MNRRLLFSISISFFLFPFLSTTAQFNGELWNAAEKLYQEKRYEEALQYFNQIEKDNEYHGNTYIRKSYINFHLKRYDQALFELDKAYAYKSLDSQYFYMKGQFLDKKGDFENAIFYFDLLINMKPNNPKYRNYRGNIHLETLHYKKAINDYDFVLALTPNKYNLYFSRGAAKFNLKMKRDACLDWLYAKEHNKSCANYFFYKCTNEDLRPITHTKTPIRHIEMPIATFKNDSNLFNFLCLELKYPQTALFNETEGTVLVKYDISDKGNLENISILHSVSEELDSEALKLIEKTKDAWQTAATLNNKNIASTHIQPISFKIEQLYPTEKSLLDSLTNILDKNLEEQLNTTTEYLKHHPLNYEVHKIRTSALKKLNIKDAENYHLIHKELRNPSTYLHPEAVSYSKCMKIFYDNGWNLTFPSHAKYYRLMQIRTNLNVNGAYKDYTTDGKLYASGSIANKKKEGLFQFYYPNGQLKSEYLFENDAPLGLWKFYHKNGKPQHLIQIKNETFDVIASFNEDGTPHIENGNGHFCIKVPIFDHSDHLIIKGSYINGKKNGEWDLSLGENFKLTEKYKKGKFLSGEYLNNGIIQKLNQPEINATSLIPGEILKASLLKYDNNGSKQAYSNLMDEIKFQFVHTY